MAKDTQTDIIPVSEYKKNYVRNKKAKPEKKEEKVQLQICRYLHEKYPDLIWQCDLASGLFLPPWIGAMHKKMRSSRGLPDLFIAHAKVSVVRDIPHPGAILITGQSYNGLFIEIKKDGIRKKDGSIPAARRKIKKTGAIIDHHAEQEAILSKLRVLGYKAEFAAGFEEAKKLIDNYLG